MTNKHMDYIRGIRDLMSITNDNPVEVIIAGKKRIYKRVFGNEKYYGLEEIPDNLPPLEKYERALVRAMKFVKHLEEYLYRQNKPYVFKEEDEHINLGNYVAQVVAPIFFGHVDELSEFDRLLVKLDFDMIPDICNICNEKINAGEISRLADIVNPRLCDKCYPKPEVQQLLRRVDPEQQVTFRELA